MKYEPLIRWTKDDRQALKKAVMNFNNKIKRLEKEGKENLPEVIDYKKFIKRDTEKPYSESEVILSRRQLNNVLNSLKRFTKRGAENLVTLDSGETITKWQKNEIRILKIKASRNINRDIARESLKRQFGMGNKKIQELQATKLSLKGIEKASGFDFRRRFESLKRQSRSDIALFRASIWKENFLKALEGLEGYDNKELLVNKINKISNPIKLYEYISQSEILNDLFLWYKDKATSQTYGGFADNQLAFDYALEELDLL